VNKASILLKKRYHIRLRGGGPKLVKKRTPEVTRRIVQNYSVNTATNYWSEIFMIGPFDQQGESKLSEIFIIDS
jgi:hypothetical protein